MEPSGRSIGAAHQVQVERRARARRSIPILQFDTSGKFLRSFGAGLFVSPHKITVDRDGFIWVADNGRVEGRGQQVIKFNKDGKVLLTLGKAGVAGPGLDTFDQPTEVAVAPNGDIFVGDGHGNAPTANARIMKFDKNGKFLKTWGKKGTGHRRVRLRPHARVRFARPTVRRRPPEQPDSDLRSGR